MLEGRVGLLIGEELLEGRGGDLVLKPRGVPHAFWNASDEPARFSRSSHLPASRATCRVRVAFSSDGSPDLDRLAALAERYGLEMDFASVPRLAAERGLDLGPPPETA